MSKPKHKLARLPFGDQIALLQVLTSDLESSTGTTQVKPAQVAKDFYGPSEERAPLVEAAESFLGSVLNAMDEHGK